MGPGKNYLRQRDIFNPDTINATAPRIHIIGCGTIGSWTTFLIYKLGLRNVMLWDFDSVEDINVPSQMFDEGDVGFFKSLALHNKYGFKYQVKPFEFEDDFKDDIFVMCVDSIVARRNILAVLPENATVIDGRMGGEGFEVHVGTASTIKLPLVGSDDLCTAKGIVYVSAGVASYIVAALKRIILGQEVDYKTRYVDYRGGSEVVIR